jgi:hypothetical protein
MYRSCVGSADYGNEHYVSINETKIINQPSDRAYGEERHCLKSIGHSSYNTKYINRKQRKENKFLYSYVY